MSITTTRIFKSGNSLAVRIPKDMIPAEIPDEAQIEWRNGVWTIRPLRRRTLAELMDRFKAFSPDFMAEGRELHEQAERDWGRVQEPAPAHAPPSPLPSRKRPPSKAKVAKG